MNNYCYSYLLVDVVVVEQAAGSTLTAEAVVVVPSEIRPFLHFALCKLSGTVNVL